MNKQQNEALKTVETALIEARSTLQELNDLGIMPYQWQRAITAERHQLTEALKATQTLKKREEVRQ